MDYLILIIVGGVGVLLGMYFGRYRARVRKEKYGGRNLIAEQSKEKEENLEKILGFLKENENATNDDIEKLLDVSDSTATRYLSELEERGDIRQIGETGRHVYYELK